MNPDQRLSTVISFVMILATATLGWISLNDRGVPHVADTRSLAQVPADEQNVVARLWEDPLQAVQAEVLKRPPPAADTSNLTEGVKQPLQAEGQKSASPAADTPHTVMAVKQMAILRSAHRKIGLLVVPIPDTPFPDDLETRLRLRYSIQMALAQEYYAPDNRNYLGYFKLPLFDPSGQEVVGEGAYVPYEWFVSRKSDSLPAVLVLWLPERLLSKAPLDVLTRLRNDLVSPAPCPKDDKLAGLFIIGPRTSDTLKKMVPVTDKADPKQQASRQAHRDALQDRLAIFSPQATTPDPVIGLDARRKWTDARGDFADKLHDTLSGTPTETCAADPWCYFYNFIAPDDQLTDLLVMEMKLRGLVFTTTEGLRDSAHKILVLAEADTAYGQSLPVALQASVTSMVEGRIDYDALGGTTSTTPELIMKNKFPDQNRRSQLRIYRYLRGLDQQKGLQQGSGTQAAKPGTKSTEEALTQILSKHGAMPLGESQLDYADRLADEIKSGPDSRNIRAVGVLGADIYDKMILLRSLRSRFPNAVFFTTDLDARLWHADHLPFTRNMIVASAYDASGIDTDKRLKDDLSSKTIAPFRDGYQVAVFRACRAALKKLSSPGSPVPPAKQPLIFEIGRNGPVPLPLASDTRTGTPASVSIAALIDWVQTEFILGLCLLMTGLVMAVFLWMANDWVKEGSWEKVRLLAPINPKTRWIGCVVVSGILLEWAYFTFMFLGRQPNGEPWAWNLGISIWPTELIRLLIIFSVITTLVWAWQHYKEARGDLIKDYFEAGEFDRILKQPSELKALRKPWCDPANRQATTVSAKNIFEIYIGKAALRCRMTRVGLAAIAYMLMAFGAMFLFEGGLPVLPHIRGGLAHVLDMVIMLCSVVGFLVLVFYVLDAVRLSALLLKGICGRDTVWAPKLLEQERAKYGVKPADLAGYLDVKFAAEKSAETGKLVFLPFIIQFLFILSRNSYFDNWTWSGTLIAIFASNILLACSAWIILRSTACQIRDEATKKLRTAIDEAKFETDGAELELDKARHKLGQAVVDKPAAAIAVESLLFRVADAKGRLRGLLRLQEKIDEEHRGAYAKFFQDPALIAMLLPTGLFGILTVLFRALFGAM